jgi:hypothetical protein
MKFSRKMMKRMLKEEYDKRIRYFLNEKISVKDKRGVNVLRYASGLKVLDDAGNQYSFGGIVKKGNEEFAKLYLPDEPREDAVGQGGELPLREDERDEIGFYSRMNSGVREIEPVDSSMRIEDFSGEEEGFGSEEEFKPKLPDRKYILMPMGEFEQRCRLKTEED